MPVPSCSRYAYRGGYIGDDFIWFQHRGSSLLSGRLDGCGYCSAQCFGAALGVVGIASYIGAGLQDVMSGILIEGQKTVVNGADVYDFTYINWFWIGAALLSALLATLVWNVKPKG